MRFKHAFRMLASLRPCFTLCRKRSARLAALVAAIGGASCSTAIEPASTEPPELEDADARDAAPGEPPTHDAPYLMPETETTEVSGSFDGSSADVADRGGFPLCLRLWDPDRPVKVLDLSADVRSGYLTLIASDCRVVGVFPSQSSAFAAWSNHLYDWNLALWGCTDRAADGFALINAETLDLTSADAALLVDDYLVAAARTLRLSRSEAAEMRRDLERLASAAITRQSDEHPFSECDADDGGEGGAEAASEGAFPLDASANADQVAGG